jgi:hypothetical protein
MATKGYGLEWRGQYALSVSTSEDQRGQQNAFVNLVGLDSHEHVWRAVPAELWATGRQLKEKSDHVSSATSLMPNGLCARAALSWDDAAGRIRVSLAEPHLNSAVSTDWVPAIRSVSSRRQPIALGHNESSEICAEFFFLRQSELSTWTGGPVLTWGPGAAWGLGLRVSAGDAI